MTPQEIIEQSTDSQFREHLLTMPVGADIQLPVAGYIRYMLMEMLPIERENMGPKMFSRNILVWRTVAEFPKHGEQSLNAAHKLIKTVDSSSPSFDVKAFLRQIKNELYDKS